MTTEVHFMLKFVITRATKKYINSYLHVRELQINAKLSNKRSKESSVMAKLRFLGPSRAKKNYST
jgi:hypothetical protein